MFTTSTFKHITINYEDVLTLSSMAPWDLIDSGGGGLKLAIAKRKRAGHLVSPWLIGLRDDVENKTNSHNCESLQFDLGNKIKYKIKTS